MNSFNERNQQKFEAEVDSSRVVVSFRPKARKDLAYRVCNLCKTSYLMNTKFDRFCSECKKDSELYHFHEWLSA